MQENPDKREVRVRSAPSPTGDPHVGTAYNVLFNYVFAKSHGGKFILRIEDTDRDRSTKQSEDMILSSLKWLGLQWDEGPDIGGPYGPYRQSERSDLYSEYTQKLLDKGAAYRCFCTKERLTELREEQKREKKNFGYDGHCRNLDPAESERRAAAGELFVVRIKIPENGETVYNDYLRGDISFANENLQDQILMKADGFPTYHLANVVDDHLMKITHVIRAEEWISSTPLHQNLYEAFEWEPPVFIHLPLLRNLDKSKMSKRKNPVSINYYRRQGFLPEALLNFLALQGWSLGEDQEIFTVKEMVDNFNVDRISLGGPVFDLKKLIKFNGMYIRNLDQKELARKLIENQLQRQLELIQNEDYLAGTLEQVQSRCNLLREFDDKAHFFFTGPQKYDVRSLIPKGKNLNQTKNIISKIFETYTGVSDWTTELLEEISRVFCEENKWTTKDFFMLLRVIITGAPSSPPLFQSMVVLGQAECLARIQDSIATLQLG